MCFIDNTAMPDRKQVRKQEAAACKRSSRKRLADTGPDARVKDSDLSNPPKEFPTWIKTARLRD